MDKICARLLYETYINVFDLIQTARDTSELKHFTLFNDVQSVSHKEIAVKTTNKQKNLRQTNVMVCPG